MLIMKVFICNDLKIVKTRKKNGLAIWTHTENVTHNVDTYMYIIHTYIYFAIIF